MGFNSMDTNSSPIKISSIVVSIKAPDIIASLKLNHVNGTVGIPFTLYNTVPFLMP